MTPDHPRPINAASNHRKPTVVIAALLAGAVLLHAATCHARTFLTGVNLAGAEFGEDHLPGIYGTHYW